MMQLIRGLPASEIASLVYGDDTERQNFEKWAEEVCALPWGYLKKRRTDDGYTERDYTHIWHGWQARSKQEAE